MDAAQRGQVKVLYQLHRYAEAEALLRACLAKDPDDSDAMVQLAQQLLAQNRALEALAPASRAVRAAPGDYWALVTLSHCHRELGAYDTAIEFADRALAVSSTDWQAFHARANAGRSGDRSMKRRAISDAEEAVRIAPESPDVHVMLGVCHDAVGHRRQARAEYESALRLDPNHPFAMNNLAVHALRRGRAGAATRHLRAGLAVSPQTATLRTNFDVVLLSRLRQCWWLMLVGASAEILASGSNAPWRVRSAIGLITLVAEGLAVARIAKTLPATTGLILRGIWGRLKPALRVSLCYWLVCAIGVLLAAFGPQRIADLSAHALALVVAAWVYAVVLGWIIRAIKRGPGQFDWARAAAITRASARGRLTKRLGRRR